MVEDLYHTEFVPWLEDHFSFFFTNHVFIWLKHDSIFSQDLLCKQGLLAVITWSFLDFSLHFFFIRTKFIRTPKLKLSLKLRTFES